MKTKWKLCCSPLNVRKVNIQIVNLCSHPNLGPRVSRLTIDEKPWERGWSHPPTHKTFQGFLKVFWYINLHSHVKALRRQSVIEQKLYRPHLVFQFLYVPMETKVRRLQFIPFTLRTVWFPIVAIVTRKTNVHITLQGATSWFFELLLSSPKLPSNWRKPENNTYER